MYTTKEIRGNMAHILTLVSESLLSANDLYGTFYPISQSDVSCRWCGGLVVIKSKKSGRESITL